jgi:hypothetical protein
MPTYTIIQTSIGYGWRIHRAGCKDIAKDARDAIGKPFTKEAVSIEALIASEIESLDNSHGRPGKSGYSAVDFEVLPCAQTKGVRR